jgi:hypothetical protein
MHALVKDIMTADVAAVMSDAWNVVDQARHVESVVAVRDRFTYPLVTEARPARAATAAKRSKQLYPRP